MRKIRLSIPMLLIGAWIYAQVGINTNSPDARLHVINPSPGNTMDIAMFGTNNCGGPCGQGTPRQLILYNQNTTNSSFASLAFVPSASGTGLTGASITGVNRNATNGYAGLSFGTRHDDGFNERMRITSTGNIGIGTTSPNANLQVNGTMRYVDGNQSANRILVSDANGNASWVDFNTLLDLVNVGKSEAITSVASGSNESFSVSSATANQASYFTIISNRNSSGDCLYLEAIVTTGSNARVDILQNDNFCDGSAASFTVTGNNTSTATINSAVTITAGSNITVSSSGPWTLSVERKVLR